MWTFLGSLFWMFVMSSAIAVWSQRSGETSGIPPEVRNWCNKHVHMLHFKLISNFHLSNIYIILQKHVIQVMSVWWTSFHVSMPLIVAIVMVVRKRKGNMALSTVFGRIIFRITLLYE